MNSTSSRALPSRRIPLAAACAVVFVGCADVAIAAPLPVTNCSDTGTGSLRASVASAVNGDTITIPGTLGCSVISLSTGAITIPPSVASLTITGPGATALYVEHAYGSPNDRVFDHQGAGTLTIQSMSVKYGNPKAAGTVTGGCIRSAGSVKIKNSSVSFCSATSTSAAASGGGIMATNVNAKYSTMIFNSTNAKSFSRGGAIYATTLLAKYDTVDTNYADSSGSASFLGSGGALYLQGAATITGSDISFNHTTGDAGGISEFSNGSTALNIENSTISNNYAAHSVGGIYASSNVGLYNSTIAFNKAKVDLNGTRHRAVGLDVEEDGYALTVKMQSTILSNNTYGNTNDDISTFESGSYTVTISGDHNLVYSNFQGPVLPADTIRFSCPRLGAWRPNGGKTGTLALLSRSPAIDAGANPKNLMYDQRQSPYIRTSAAPDIGAFEVQQEDTLFNTDFEGCPVVF